MNRRDVIKSAVALAIYGSRFSARAQIVPSGGAKSTVLPQAGTNSIPFPRTAIIATAGSGTGNNQDYPPTPFSGQVTPIGSNGIFSSGTYGGDPVAWMGRFDLVLIGGDWEQWDQSGNFDRGLLVDAIKQVTNVSGYSPSYVFQYVIEEVFLTASDSNPFNSWYPTVVSEKWALFASAGQSGSYVSTGQTINGYTAYETNWATAWPNAVGSTARDQCFSTGRTTAAYDGSPEDMPQYSAAYFIESYITRHSSFSGAVSGTIPASAYTDPRFYPTLVSGANHDQMRAPNVDGFQLDNVFAYPRYGGYYDLVNNYAGSSNDTEWNSPVGPWIVRGAQHFFARCQQILAEAYPSRTYYNFCNFAAWDNVHALDTGGVFSAMSNGLSATMHGGVLEGEIGTVYGIEANFGWPALLSFYNAMMDFCLNPKLILLGTSMNSSTDYQHARYNLCSSLMDDGFCQITTNESYVVDDYVWLDEFGGNPNTDIKKAGSAKGWGRGRRPLPSMGFGSRSSTMELRS